MQPLIPLSVVSVPEVHLIVFYDVAPFEHLRSTISARIGRSNPISVVLDLAHVPTREVHVRCLMCIEAVSASNASPLPRGPSVIERGLVHHGASREDAEVRAGEIGLWEDIVAVAVVLLVHV